MIPKFRVWLTIEKKMLYEDDFHPARWGFYGRKWRAIRKLDNLFVCQENAALMQFIGLKDKNGKEIFEGDIIKTDADYKTFFIVEWCNEGGMMAGFCGKNIQAEGKPKTDYYLHKGKHIEIQYLSLMEVVGNIYENPALLKMGVKKYDHQAR